MSYADNVFIENCRHILTHGVWDTDQEVRPKWEDGTPAHTVKAFGIVNRYDLQREFPIQTIRRMYLKSAVDELLWIWQKKSNNIKDLNSHIWDAWAVPQTSQKLVEVRRKRKERPEKLHQVVVDEIVDPSAEKRQSINYGAFYILQKEGKRYKIQFEKTGWITEVSQTSASCGQVKDLYQRSVNGVGYYGLYRSEDILEYFGSHHHRWVITWQNMVRRCSGVYSGNPEWYEGVFVDDDFQCCETFLRWVMANNRYGKEYLDILQIDKDYYGANYYGPDSCTLLTPKENTALTLDCWYKMDDIVFYSIADMAKYFTNQLNIRDLYNPSGSYNDYKMRRFIDTLIETGRMMKIFHNNGDLLVRFDLEVDKTILRSYGYQLGVKHSYPEGKMDQVDRVLFDLKHNPASRRIMTNMYNHHDLSEMALYPCAYSMTFNVSGNVLNAILHQRSQDMLTANGWNVMQYAVLVHMMAQVSGLVPGELVHVIADAHIYDRHVPVVEEIINRKPKDAPEFKLNPWVKDFYAFTTEDIRLVGYNPHELHAKIPVAV